MSREDTTHPGCDRQRWPPLGPCTLTWCLILGEPKESPTEGDVGSFSPTETSLELLATACAAGAGPHQGANTPVGKQCPWPRGQHTDAHLRAFTEVSLLTLPFCLLPKP